MFNSFVRKLNWLIIVIAAIWTLSAAFIIFEGWQLNYLKPLSEPENFLPKENPYIMQQEMLEKYYSTNEDKQLDVTIFFGVKMVDRTNVAHWDVVNVGNVIFDDKFSISDEQSWKAVKKLCDDLRVQ